MRDWSRTTDAPFILLTNYLHWRKANWTSVNADRAVMKAFHRDSALHVNRGFRGINAFWRSGKTKFLSTVQNELQLLWLCVVSARSALSRIHRATRIAVLHSNTRIPPFRRHYTVIDRWGFLGQKWQRRFNHNFF